MAPATDPALVAIRGTLAARIGDADTADAWIQELAAAMLADIVAHARSATSAQILTGVEVTNPFTRLQEGEDADG